VAQFIGSPTINLLPVHVHEHGAVTLFGRPVPISTDLRQGTMATLGIRPELLRPVGAGASASQRPVVSFPARLRRSEHLGSEKILHFEAADLAGATVTSRVGADVSDAEMASTELAFDPVACHLFDADGTRRQFAGNEERQIPRGRKGSAGAHAMGPTP
jgi:multiple sugar transport system ATP-binding protein